LVIVNVLLLLLVLTRKYHRLLLYIRGDLKAFLFSRLSNDIWWIINIRQLKVWAVNISSKTLFHL